MNDKGTLISVKDALDIVLGESRKFGIEEIDFKLSEGRILKEKIKADREMPPFDRVSMDGIALKSTVFKSSILGYCFCHQVSLFLSIVALRAVSNILRSKGFWLICVMPCSHISLSGD